jgi:hypothetical protein
MKLSTVLPRALPPQTKDFTQTVYSLTVASALGDI